VGEEYQGFGAAAHSKTGQALQHIVDLEKYAENVMAGNNIVDMTEEIGNFERASEYLMLRLRTTHGISEKEYYDIYPCSMEKAVDLFRFYESQGWAEYSGDRWSFTPEGFLLSNTLISEILETQTKQRSEMTRPWENSEDAAYRTQLKLLEQKPQETQLFRGI
jgi:oxygen-independent coproporphyrinogen-3 oxidase